MTHIGPPAEHPRPRPATPHVISVLSQKGGTGKTTLSCALAALAVGDGIATAILDLDPQASAAKWHDLRRANGTGEPPVYATPSSRMHALIEGLGNDGAELIVNDTAPHSGADAVTVARLSHVILIPVQPSLPDLAAVTRTIEIADLAGKPAVVVLNLALSNHPSAGEARRVIATTSVAAAPVVLHRRIAHVNSFNNGQCAAEYEPRGKAAGELRALFAWLQAAGILPRARKGRAA